VLSSEAAVRADALECPFCSQWDRGFESPFLQRRVVQTLFRVTGFRVTGFRVTGPRDGPSMRHPTVELKIEGLVARQHQGGACALCRPGWRREDGRVFERPAGSPFRSGRRSIVSGRDPSTCLSSAQGQSGSQDLLQGRSRETPARIGRAPKPEPRTSPRSRSLSTGRSCGARINSVRLTTTDRDFTGLHSA
jgi:hypothetical protein